MTYIRSAIAILEDTQWAKPKKKKKDPFKGKNVVRVTLQNLKDLKPYLR